MTDTGEPAGPDDSRLRIIAFGVLPAVVVALGAGAGVLRWQESSHREIQAARSESVAAARDITVAILSYRAGTVEQDLRSARDRLTGTFLDSYTDLIDNVVIPGAKEKNITSEARVSAAASVSAAPTRAVALVFVDQRVVQGADAPSGTASSVRVTLDKVGDRWLVSGFDPV
jgi:Mce-associated membrane protein